MVDTTIVSIVANTRQSSVIDLCSGHKNQKNIVAATKNIQMATIFILPDIARLSHQIKKRKYYNPKQVNHVPKARTTLNKSQTFHTQTALPGLHIAK